MPVLQTLRRIGGIALASGAAVTLAAPALAACSLTAEGIAAADVAFVGRLTDVSADGAQAIFEIEDVWRGPGLSIGASSPVVFGHTPGLFQMPPAGAPAVRYLVLARTVGGQLRTGEDCRSAFPFPWDASYAAFRPVDASLAPTLEGTPGEGVPGPLLGLMAIAAVIGGVGWLAFRSQRPRG